MNTTSPSDPAEAEAERRYPSISVLGLPRIIEQGKRDAFAAGASWQREQSAPLSNSERDECLRVLEPFVKAYSSRGSVMFSDIQNAAALAARLR